MAEKVIRTVVDDIDGTELPAGNPKTYLTYDGVSYALDLSDENRSKLADALEPFLVDSARVGGAVRKQVTGDRGDRGRQVTEWAVEQGLRKPGQRGRLSKDILEAYDAAH
ncbi:MAG TPA: Lsr2 family protein [Rhodoglobus sp.]|nr:Lsr2 family protein [Rhodoglobus sp.]